MAGNGAPTAVRVRGIYATALTALLLDRGFTVVDPSPPIQQRFSLPESDGDAQVEIHDRYDRQGVLLEGDPEEVDAVVGVLRRGLPDPVCCPMEAPAGRARVAFEFHAEVKQALDGLRCEVLPTLPSHHYFKSIAPERVDQAERQLTHDAGRAGELAKRLREDLIRRHYHHGMPLPIRHVKPDGRAYDLRGRFSGWREGRVLLERRFRGGGSYDSLNLPKREGDHGILEVREGSWISRRAYFRADNSLIGELYNIGTPAELYPDHIRYLDLEVDVLHLPGQPPRVIDLDELEHELTTGTLTARLGEHAEHLAREVSQALADGRPNDVWAIQ
jgi:hypothetical protein